MPKILLLSCELLLASLAPPAYTTYHNARFGYRFDLRKKVLKSNIISTLFWEYPATRKAAMDAVIQHTI